MVVPFPGFRIKISAKWLFLMERKSWNISISISSLQYKALVYSLKFHQRVKEVLSGMPDIEPSEASDEVGLLRDYQNIIGFSRNS